MGGGRGVVVEIKATETEISDKLNWWCYMVCLKNNYCCSDLVSRCCGRRGNASKLTQVLD